MNDKDTPEEVSVRDLMGLFAVLWQKIVRQFLLVVLFVIKHIIPLIILLILGVGLAFLNKGVESYRVTYTISTTEFSGKFLAESLQAISDKLREDNLKMKKELSVSDIDFEVFSFDIEPIYDKRTLMERGEYQHLNFAIENKLIDKEEQKEVFIWSNTSYKVDMVYPIELDPEIFINSVLDYLRKDAYASQLHKEIIEDINRQVESNNQMLSALGNYVESLAKSSEMNSENLQGLVLGTGTDIGELLYARVETQKVNNKLIAEKVKLEENFRILYQTHAKKYFGTGIKSKKHIVYPFLLISIYLFVLFLINSVRRALLLDKENKKMSS